MNPREIAEQEAEIQSGPDPLGFDEERPDAEEIGDEEARAMRTWTLRGWYEGEENEKDYVSTGPRIGPHGPVEVVELRPVLDLLERLHFAHEPYSNGDLRKDVTALLREHGRLG